MYVKLFRFNKWLGILVGVKEKLFRKLFKEEMRLEISCELKVSYLEEIVFVWDLWFEYVIGDKE